MAEIPKIVQPVTFVEAEKSANITKRAAELAARANKTQNERFIAITQDLYATQLEQDMYYQNQLDIQKEERDKLNEIMAKTNSNVEAANEELIKEQGNKVKSNDNPEFMLAFTQRSTEQLTINEELTKAEEVAETLESEDKEAKDAVSEALENGSLDDAFAATLKWNRVAMNVKKTINETAKKVVNTLESWLDALDNFWDEWGDVVNTLVAFGLMAYEIAKDAVKTIQRLVKLIDQKGFVAVITDQGLMDCLFINAGIASATISSATSMASIFNVSPYILSSGVLNKVVVASGMVATGTARIAKIASALADKCKIQLYKYGVLSEDAFESDTQRSYSRRRVSYATERKQITPKQAAYYEYKTKRTTDVTTTMKTKNLMNSDTNKATNAKATEAWNDLGYRMKRRKY